MAVRSIATLKSWLLTGKKPTQQQFHDWLDSYLHKDEGVEIENVAGLTEELSEKADVIQLDNYVLKAEGLLLIDEVADLEGINKNDCALALVKDFAILAPLQTVDLPNNDTTFASSLDGWLWIVVLKPFGDGTNTGGMLADRFSFNADHTYELPDGNFADMICLKPTGNQTITVTVDGEVVFSEEMEGGKWYRAGVDWAADGDGLDVVITGVTDEVAGIVYKRTINAL